MTGAAEAAAEAVARQSYGKLVAFVAARTGDVAGAEDALSDAFAAALADWPRTGVPARPEAWSAASRSRARRIARRARPLPLHAGAFELAATHTRGDEICRPGG